MTRKCVITGALALSVFAASAAEDATYRRIEECVAAAERENGALAAKLTDAVSLEAYRDRVVVRDGTNIWTTALQAALDTHAIVTIPASAMPYFIDAPLVVPSNRRIIAHGATVRLADGVTTLLLRNANAKDGTLAPVAPGLRDANIAIEGGRWEDWQTRRCGYGRSGTFAAKHGEKGNFYGVSTLFLFENCDHVTVRDVTFANCAAFAVQSGGGDAHVYSGIRFDNCFADGLHLNGNLTRVLCRDIRGKVGDDLVALNAYDWLNSSVDFGPQRFILCEDLELVLKDGRGYPAIRIQPACYRYADGSIVDCSVSDVIFRRVKGIRTFKMYLQTPPYRVGQPGREWARVGSGGNLYFEKIDIDLDAPIDVIGEYKTSDPVRGHFGAFEFGANLTALTFRDIDITFHADRWPLSHLVTVGPKSSTYRTRDYVYEVFDPYVTCEVGAVTLENIRTRGVVPKELVRATVFRDINADGESSGEGRILKLTGVK